MTTVKEFLAALPSADDKAFVTPPGLGGGWRAGHVRKGLERHVLVVHSSGDIICFAPFPSSHGACQHCASRKGAICDHCRCAFCQFDELTAEHGGPRITPEQVARLRVKIREFQIGRKPRVVVALDDAI